MPKLQRNTLKSYLFQKAMEFANKLASLPNRITPPPFRLIQIGSAYWQSRALYVATELGIADILGDHEMSSTEIAAKLNLAEDHLYRLLRMLCSQGVFSERGQHCFRNNRLSNHLRSDHPKSVRAMIRLHNSPEISKPWFETLLDSMRSGETPFVMCFGEKFFHYMDSHPQFDALFTEAMEAVEALTGTDYLHDFDWGVFERIIDIGGSNGKKSAAILQSHPQLKALVFDRAQVVTGATDYWRNKLPPTVLERMAFEAGDMFAAIPPARSDLDLYLFVAVFHSMAKDEAVTVLDNLRSACGLHRPTIVIVDMVAQPEHIDPNIATFDMQMLANTRGRERTLDEWHEILNVGGFSIDEVVNVRSLAKLLVVRINAVSG